LNRADKAVVLRFLERVSGYSRQQVSRLVKRGSERRALVTKWNFLPFRPGLVGGHCIGVDPYYLTHKAQEIGYHAEVKREEFLVG
jgi:hypothetical protein